MRMNSCFIDNPDIDSVLNIRTLKESDLPELEWNGEYIHYRRLYKEIFQSAKKGNSILWVIELPNTGLVGQLFVQLKSPRRELADGNLVAYFFAFRIKESNRGCGIGTKLLEHAEEDLSIRNFKYATLNVSKNNFKALRFYSKNGYNIVANEPGHWFYVDHLGIRQEVNQPSWRLEKKI